jgi:hypothetical protein
VELEVAEPDGGGAVCENDATPRARRTVKKTKQRIVLTPEPGGL